jgi:hypothetical protein
MSSCKRALCRRRTAQAALSLFSPETLPTASVALSSLLVALAERMKVAMCR